MYLHVLPEFNSNPLGIGYVRLGKVRFSINFYANTPNSNIKLYYTYTTVTIKYCVSSNNSYPKFLKQLLVSLYSC